MGLKKHIFFKWIIACSIICAFSNESFAESHYERHQVRSRVSQLIAQIVSLSTSLQDIKNQINAANIAIDKLEAKPVITSHQASLLSDFESEKEKLNDLGEKLSADELQISYDQVSLSQQYFQIFSVLFGTFTAFAIAASTGIFFFFRKEFQKIGRQHSEEIEKNFKTSSIITIADMCASIIMPFFERYEEQYQLYKIGASGFTTIDSFIRDVRLALQLSEIGYDYVTSLPTEIYLGGDERALKAYAMLINHWVYHKSVELDCMGKPMDESAVFRLLQEAENCLILSENKKLSRLWYNLQQTAAFAFLLFGEDDLKEKARNILRNLIDGTTPNRPFERPPQNWRKSIFEEFFPKNQEGEFTDPKLIGLDKIKYRP